MAANSMQKPLMEIPEQTRINWRIAFAVSWGAMRRRFLRLLITMAGVILAIAFLAYMLITDGVTRSLVAVNDDRLNMLLQEAGTDVYASTQTNELMLLLIGLSLLTCLVGIVNSMLMSVAERVREIGTLKCLGALDTFIVKTYFIESALQGIIGTLIGIALGMVVALATAWANYEHFVFEHFPLLPVVKSMGLAFVTGSLLSVAAAIGPAYLAAKKQPVEAMRVEE
jgi:predicted lysophospholipase L1 biosynthesis ABC-type transport system permease subunit